MCLRIRTNVKLGAIEGNRQARSCVERAWVVANKPDLLSNGRSVESGGKRETAMHRYYLHDERHDDLSLVSVTRAAVICVNKIFSSQWPGTIEGFGPHGQV